jgi:DNA invertase Pin-like site-specific DNA recombinase
MRTREGMAVTNAQGKLKGKQPKLSPMQSHKLRRMFDTGDYSISDLSDVFKVSRPTIYRTLARQPSASGPSIKGKPATVR